jgi:uncharacterized membrane protein YphA (DoxX/SURF4 family)
MKADIEKPRGLFDRQQMNTGRDFLLDWLLRLILGGTFIYASLHKMAFPADFARILYGYGIFPGSLINLLALWVPFIEILSGICLISGGFGMLSKEAGLAVINLMLLSFVLIIGFNLFRGHEFDCGCFSFDAGPADGLKQAAVRLMIRDVLLLGAGFFLWRRFRQKSGHADQSEA